MSKIEELGKLINKILADHIFDNDVWNIGDDETTLELKRALNLIQEIKDEAKN